MNYLTYYKRLQYLRDAIEKGLVHSPKSFADRLNCSEKTVRNMINQLRSEDFAVRYCRSRGRYVID